MKSLFFYLIEESFFSLSWNLHKKNWKCILYSRRGESLSYKDFLRSRITYSLTYRSEAKDGNRSFHADIEVHAVFFSPTTNPVNIFSAFFNTQKLISFLHKRLFTNCEMTHHRFPSEASHMIWEKFIQWNRTSDENKSRKGSALHEYTSEAQSQWIWNEIEGFFVGAFEFSCLSLRNNSSGILQTI